VGKKEEYMPSTPKKRFEIGGGKKSKNESTVYGIHPLTFRHSLKRGKRRKGKRKGGKEGER